MCHVICCLRAPRFIIKSAVPCIGFDVLADKICSVHSNIHPQHATSVAAVLAMMQLMMTQMTSNAEDNADINADNNNANTTQMMDNNADDG